MLALPGTTYLLIAFAFPLAALLITSFETEGGFGIARYQAFLADEFHQKVIANTVRAALWTTLCCLLLGYPTAFVLAWSRGALQTVLLVAMIMPLSVGVVVKAFAWAIVLRSDGVLNQTLLAIGAIDEPLRLIFTQTGFQFSRMFFESILFLNLFFQIGQVRSQLLIENKGAGSTDVFQSIAQITDYQFSGLLINPEYRSTGGQYRKQGHGQPQFHRKRKSHVTLELKIAPQNEQAPDLRLLNSPRNDFCLNSDVFFMKRGKQSDRCNLRRD